MTQAEANRKSTAKALIDLSNALSVSIDQPDALQTTVDGIARLMDLDSAAVYLLEKTTLRLHATSPPLDPATPEEFLRADIKDHPHIRRAITGKKTILVRDAKHAKLSVAEAAIRDGRGLRTLIYAPLITAGKVIGVLIAGTVGSPRPIAPEEIDALGALAAIAALIIERTAKTSLLVRSEERYKSLFNDLEETLHGLVATLALTVEIRDPYTAEHQRRVTELTVAIAQEAGLPADDIAGLEMAAAIHDIGKIYVPAETLNKPGKVTPVEFELIKTHAAAGYDIVKDVKFKYPIAAIIRQHHERIDGSGYPDGLKGEDISVGARIMAIADVVEAMSSHRPYRPALGIDAALAEITQHSGTAYDPKMAAICVKLFKAKKFAFK